MLRAFIARRRHRAIVRARLSQYVTRRTPCACAMAIALWHATGAQAAPGTMPQPAHWYVGAQSPTYHAAQAVLHTLPTMRP